MDKPTGLGIWCATNVLKPAELAALANSIEDHGYQTLWYPESLSYESFAMAGFLLANSTRLQVASGIANIYARDAVTSAQGHDSLNRMYDGRFVLGLGVSHVPLVEGARGHDYKKPVTTMRNYLHAMADAKLDPTIAMKDRAVVLAVGRARRADQAEDRPGRGRLAHPDRPGQADHERPLESFHGPRTARRVASSTTQSSETKESASGRSNDRAVATVAPPPPRSWTISRV